MMNNHVHSCRGGWERA